MSFGLERVSDYLWDVFETDLSHHGFSLTPDAEPVARCFIANGARMVEDVGSTAQAMNDAEQSTHEYVWIVEGHATIRDSSEITPDIIRQGAIDIFCRFPFCTPLD